MATKNTNYQLHLKGFVGGYDFDADYVDYVLGKNAGKEVHVLIDSLGGKSNTALSIFSAFKRHGNVNVQCRHNRLAGCQAYHHGLVGYVLGP